MDNSGKQTMVICPLMLQLLLITDSKGLSLYLTKDCLYKLNLQQNFREGFYFFFDGDFLNMKSFF